MRFSAGTRLVRLARGSLLTALDSATGGGGGRPLPAGVWARGWVLAWMTLPSAPLALATLASLVLRLGLGLGLGLVGPASGLASFLET